MVKLTREERKEIEEEAYKNELAVINKEKADLEVRKAMLKGKEKARESGLSRARRTSRKIGRGVAASKRAVKDTKAFAQGLSNELGYMLGEPVSKKKVKAKGRGVGVRVRGALVAIEREDSSMDVVALGFGGQQGSGKRKAGSKKQKRKRASDPLGDFVRL